MGFLTTSPSIRTGWTIATLPLITSLNSGWEAVGGPAVGEPTVLYDATAGFTMYYDASVTAPALGIATCPAGSDPTVVGNWTRYSGNPVYGQGVVTAGQCLRPSVVKVGSTWYLYYSAVAVAAGPIMVATSTDGINFGSPSTALAANAAGSGFSGWANTTVWNEGGTSWYMLVEGRSTAASPLYEICYCTSSDGLSWTVVTAPLPSLAGTNVFGGQSGGPWIPASVKVAGKYWMWFHGGPELGGPAAGPVNTYVAQSTDRQTWTVSPGDELKPDLSTFRKDQASDPSIIDGAAIGPNSPSYMFFNGPDNTLVKAWIGVATYPGTLADYVLWR